MRLVHYDSEAENLHLGSASRGFHSACRLGRDPVDAAEAPWLLDETHAGNRRSRTGRQPVTEPAGPEEFADTASQKMARAHQAKGAVSLQRVDQTVGSLVAEARENCKSSFEETAS
jgi:hypothetical protein